MSAPGPVPGHSSRVDFKRWLSITWADIVAHPDEEQRRRHLAAGTGVDYAQGIKLVDPRRMAVYFAKYGAGRDGQGVPAPGPARVADDRRSSARSAGPTTTRTSTSVRTAAARTPSVTEEGSVGRFWGYRGLHRELAIRQVTPEVGIAAGRIARRWYRAKGLTKTVTVQRVEQATGRVPHRRSTVRKRLFSHGRGFLCVNDGPTSRRSSPDTSPARW